MISSTVVSHMSQPCQSTTQSRGRTYSRQTLTKVFGNFVGPGNMDDLVRAIHGDVDAAGKLVLRVPKNALAATVGLFFVLKGPVEPFRVLLESALKHDGVHLAGGIGLKRLPDVFRYAQFELPDLPETMRIWRGTNGVSKRKATNGISWTTDRDVACWFAMRFAHLDSPLVLCAEISRTDVFYYSNDRNESEVVTFGVKSPVIDGYPSEWSERHEAFVQKREADYREWFPSNA